MTVEVRDMIREYLQANGYDGLYDPDGICGCAIDDLFPCDPEGGVLDCKAGHKIPCPGEETEYGICEGHCDWHIGEKP